MSGSDNAQRSQHIRRHPAWPWITLGLILLSTTLQLRLQGRLWWCECRSPALWWGDTTSNHNSQHLFDPYVFTHMLHGVVFCGVLAWACPRWTWAWRLCLAMLIESGWELLENTSFIIERYRTATASVDYFGDTVANSLGDIVGCGLGFWLAWRIGVRGSVALFAVTELVLIVWIRDSLLLSILMLIHPIEAIKNWQLSQGVQGGHWRPSHCEWAEMWGSVEWGFESSSDFGPLPIQNQDVAYGQGCQAARLTVGIKELNFHGVGRKKLHDCADVSNSQVLVARTSHDSNKIQESGLAAAHRFDSLRQYIASYQAGDGL